MDNCGCFLHAVFFLPICPKLGGKRKDMEYFPGNLLVFSDVGGFAQTLYQLFTAFKAISKQMPVLFQPEHSISASAKGDGVFLQQRVHKGFQRLCGGALG